MIRFRSVCAAMTLVSIILIGCGRKHESPREIIFQTDFGAALNLSVQKKMPLLVFFYRSDCPWSKMMDDSTFSNKLVIGMSASMIFARIDIQKDTMAARQAGVIYYPTTVVYKSTGEEIDRLVGFYPPADYFNEVQLFLRGRETLEDYLTRLSDEPDNIDYILAIAEKYRDRSNFVEALKYYEMILNSAAADSSEYRLPALFETAVLYGELGDTVKSFANFAKFMTSSQDSLKIQDAFRRIGHYRAIAKNKEGALAQYKKYLKSFPSGTYVSWVRERIEELRIQSERE